jgi:hypothetical protein
MLLFSQARRWPFLGSRAPPPLLLGISLLAFEPFQPGQQEAELVLLDKSWILFSDRTKNNLEILTAAHTLGLEALQR